MKLPPSHPNGVQRIQVGCGPHNIFDDWWNVDIRSFKGIDQVMDVTQPWPWLESLDYVYGEHFLEHLSFSQAMQFLSEAANSLKVGGRIRLSTPSLEWVIKTHFTFDQQQLAETKKLDQTWAINRAFHGWGHRFLYSKEMLSRALEAAGFRCVEFFKYGVSNDPSLRGLERHGGWSVAHGFPSVWIVEAKREAKKIAQDPTLLEEADSKFNKYVIGGH